MLSLPLVAPRDSHELWFGSYRSPSYASSNNNGADSAARRQLHNGTGHHNTHGHNGAGQPQQQQQQQQQQYAPSTRTLLSSTTPSDSLALLQLEERALRLRKENIASFGCAWIKPAGCPKTMLGMREEEAEREEGLAAAAQELNMAAMVAAGGGMPGAGGDMDAFGDPSLQQQQMAGDGNIEGGVPGGDGDGIGADELERDLDDDIPEADDGYGDLDDEDGLVEDGEEGYEEEDVEEELMERNLDDDIPEGFPEDDDDDDDNDDDDEEDEDDDEHDGDLTGGIMVHDLDEDIPEADDLEDEDMDDDEEREEGEWQHTDSELEDNDDSDLDDDDDDTHDPYAEHIRRGADTGVSANTQTPGSANTRPGASARRRQHRDSTHLPPPPSTNARQTRETEAQRRFLQRWSGGGMESDFDALDTSAITMDDEDEDLRASITGRARGFHGGHSRQSQGRFSRFMRRGGPRDSLD